MNKYILMLGVAAVSISSYCSYAGNSATMTVTATIAHDVSLSVTQDMNLGTITVDPAYTGNDTYWYYNDSGVITYRTQGAIVSAPDITVGTFIANIPNPSACDTAGDPCGGLMLMNSIDDLFGGSIHDNNGCVFYIKYSGSSNTFNVYPFLCTIETPTTVTTGNHNGTLTISYTAS
ncbi:MAG: hypothetical protein IJ689_00730 [Alphaproteobacteria bacterium]|nr:hypothetical protein [Alphaproteobacteria bacterium]